MNQAIGPAPVGGDGPRGFVGGLWHEMGELQFRYLVDQGLRPEHVLLDIACGALRGGVRLIPYLNTGNYLGIEIDAALVRHGLDIELGPTLCALKSPEIIISGGFEFGLFSRVPDFALAQSLFSHLVAADITKCLSKLRAVAKPSTTVFVTFLEVESPMVAGRPTSHPHAAFYYTQAQMQSIASEAGWLSHYVGDWGHPRGQRMVRLVPD